jgi:hypothetical protein
LKPRAIAGKPLPTSAARARNSRNFPHRDIGTVRALTHRMTQSNDPRFSRSPSPSPMPYPAQHAHQYPAQYAQHHTPAYAQESGGTGTVVMSHSPAALPPEPATLVYRPRPAHSTTPQPSHQRQAPSYPPPAQAAPSYATPVPHAAMSMPFPSMSIPRPHVPGLGALEKMNTPSGMPAGLSFGFGIVAVVVALVCDVVFLNVNIPGIGGYAWYLSTALSFAGAGFASAKMTRASRTLAMTAVGVAGALYGMMDIAMDLVLEHSTLGDAMFLGIQGLVIAIFTGSGGVYRGLRARG